jgi:general secretion pathway protein G
MRVQQRVVWRRGSLRRGRRRSAFTLLEVMIVIAIILMLSGLIGIALFVRRDQAREDLVRVDMNTIQSAMRMFNLDYGRWPTDEEGVAVLWDRNALDPDADENKWKGYLDRPMPRDRWGHEWVYRAESETREGYYDLFSVGPDGMEGTDDDISLWDDDEEDDFGYQLPPGRP